MKKIKIIFAIIIAIATTSSVNAQTNKAATNTESTIQTQSIKVYGECGMCKSRIEKASKKIAGVQSATWDETTKMLTLKLNPANKDAADLVEKKLAAIGHDTEHYTATDAAYNNLPDCCHYDRKTVKQ
jgi:hypothetical protein